MLQETHSIVASLVNRSTSTPFWLSLIFSSSLSQQRHWTVKCRSGRLGVCVWVPAPGAASATAHVTSSYDQPTLEPPALSWRNRLNVYHTAACNSSSCRVHEHACCRYATHWDFVSLLPDFKRFLYLDRRVYEARGSIVFVTAQFCKFKMWRDNSEGRQI